MCRFTLFCQCHCESEKDEEKGLITDNKESEGCWSNPFNKAAVISASSAAINGTLLAVSHYAHWNQAASITTATTTTISVLAFLAFTCQRKTIIALEQAEENRGSRIKPADTSLADANFPSVRV